jgi:hypothetical protein
MPTGCSGAPDYMCFAYPNGCDRYLSVTDYEKDWHRRNNKGEIDEAEQLYAWRNK